MRGVQLVFPQVLHVPWVRLRLLYDDDKQLLYYYYDINKDNNYYYSSTRTTRASSALERATAARAHASIAGWRRRA